MFLKGTGCRAGHSFRSSCWGLRFNRIYSNNEVEKLRNIAIVAHVDAGKTTFTERALFYSGYISSMGSVDSGTTVTDFSSVERDRGITVNSSCIVFNWNLHRFNLIDTPGHCDFSIGVDQSLRVIDGSIMIMDAKVGVEPQTEVVWNKSNAYRIPRLVFLNKFDHFGADIGRSLESLKGLRGHGVPLLVQYPVIIGKKIGVDDMESSSRRILLVDLIMMEVLDWEEDKRTGSIIRRITFREDLFPEEVNRDIIKSRVDLVETLSNVSSEVVDDFLKVNGDHLKVAPEVIINAIRVNTINGELYPVFCGSSLKNIGIQSALNGVIQFLPSPIDIDVPSVLRKNSDIALDTLCALVFNVVYNFSTKSMVSFVRVYSGRIRPSDKLWNTNKEVQEKVSRVAQIHANEYRDIEVLHAGDIGAITGLKSTSIGDTLSTNARLVLQGVDISPGLFMMSCTPSGQTRIEELVDALEIIRREDPSIRILRKEQANTLTIYGMGSLHLEIIDDRLRSLHKVQFTMSKVKIAYLEVPLWILNSEVREHKVLVDKKIFGKIFKAEVVLRVKANLSLEPAGNQPLPIYKIDTSDCGNKISVDIPKENPSQKNQITALQKSALINGVRLALSYGPLIGYQVSGLEIVFKHAKSYIGSQTQIPALRMAAANCIKEILDADEIVLLEPVCETTIITPDGNFPEICRNLMSCPDIIIKTTSYAGLGLGDEERKLICTLMPLRIVSKYTETLRALSRGRASISSRFCGYTYTQDQSRILEDIKK